MSETGSTPATAARPQLTVDEVEHALSQTLAANEAEIRLAGGHHFGGDPSLEQIARGLTARLNNRLLRP
jgi:type IV secretory pathway VirJ component